MVFYEVPGGREVLTGEVSTHSWKCQFHVLLWDFASGRKQIIRDEHSKRTKKNRTDDVQQLDVRYMNRKKNNKDHVVWIVMTLK